MQISSTQESEIQKDPLPNGAVMEMIRIPGGKFKMGGNDEKREQPIHEVAVQGFYLGKYPVTNKQYLEFVRATDTNHPEWMEAGSEYNIKTGTEDHYKKLGDALTNDRHPIVGVSWENASAYCEWLSELSGKRYRLPSEAEWEYAARGGQESLGFRYAGSNKLKEVGWYDLNSHRETKPVGLKLPNELGLYDMSGNVWEWCADYWHDNYEGAPTYGSAWLEGGEKAQRVVRGGSWFDYDYYCTVSYRDRYDTDDRYVNVGFRLARY